MTTKKEILEFLDHWLNFRTIIGFRNLIQDQIKNLEKLDKTFLEKINKEIKEIKTTNEKKTIFKNYWFENFERFSKKYELNEIENAIYDDWYIEGMKNVINIFLSITK